MVEEKQERGVFYPPPGKIGLKLYSRRNSFAGSIQSSSIWVVLYLKVSGHGLGTMLLLIPGNF